MTYIISDLYQSQHLDSWTLDEPLTFTEAKQRILDLYRAEGIDCYRTYVLLDYDWFNSSPWIFRVLTNGEGEPEAIQLNLDRTETAAYLKEIRAHLALLNDTRISLMYLPGGPCDDLPVEQWEIDAVDNSTPMFNQLVALRNYRHNNLGV